MDKVETGRNSRRIRPHANDGNSLGRFVLYVAAVTAAAGRAGSMRSNLAAWVR